VESAETAVYALIEAGANDFLNKPLDLDDLSAALTRLWPEFSGQNPDLGV
jgi:ActR/RegA family two-component response regulator